MQYEDILKIKSNEVFPIELRKHINQNDILAHEQINRSGDDSFSTHNAQMSTIWSKIIETAGRFTQRHSSDILIPYNTLTKEMESGKIDTLTYLFGFRESGVDGIELLFGKLISAEGKHCLNYGYYRKIYVLSLETTDDDAFGTILDLKLIDITP